MNDFTKEELKLLGGCVFSKRLSSLDGPSIQKICPNLKKIQDKIEVMIDSYCEHEELFKGNDGWSKCKKCGEFYR